MIDRGHGAAASTSSLENKREFNLRASFIHACSITKRSFKGNLAVLQSARSLLIGPALLFVILMWAGWWFFDLVANRQFEHEVHIAETLMTGSIGALQLALHRSFQPAQMLASLMAVAGSWSAFKPSFQPLAQVMFDQVPSGFINNIRALPNGFLDDVYPPHLMGDECFEVVSNPIYRAVALKTIKTQVPALDWVRHVVTNEFTGRVRVPIYVPNVSADENFGHPPGVLDCDICYNPKTRTKFMGFVSVEINTTMLGGLESRELSLLRDSGFLFKLTRQDGNQTVLLAQTEVAPYEGYCSKSFGILGDMWTLTISKSDVESKPMAYRLFKLAVLITSLLTSALLLRVLLLHKQHQLLLLALVPTSVINRALDDTDILFRAGHDIEEDPCDGACTPLTKVLSMTADMLEGRMPDTKDILMIRNAIIHSWDLQSPINLVEQMEASLDDEVMRSLMQRLGQAHASRDIDPSMRHDKLGQESSGGVLHSSGMVDPGTGGRANSEDYLKLGLLPPSVEYNSGNLLKLGLLPPSGESNSGDLLKLGLLPASGEPNSVELLKLFQLHVRSDQNSGELTSLAHELSFGEEGGSDGEQGLAGLLTKAGPQGATVQDGQQLLGKAVHKDSSDKEHGPAELLMKAGPQGAAVLKGQQLLGKVVQKERKKLQKAQSFAFAQSSSGKSSSSAALTAISSRVGRCKSQQVLPAHKEFSSTFATQQVVSPSQTLTSQVEFLLEDAYTNWQYDSFALEEVTGGHGLSCFMFFIMKETGLMRRFGLPENKLVKFLKTVEESYGANPYHSNIHALDVLQTFHVIVTRGGFIPGYVDQHTHLACYLAAFLHDFKHEGVTNDFLVNSNNDLAVRYNDCSPMENHHLAQGFALIKRSDMNFLSALSRAEFVSLRKMVIDLVLGTDMKQHFAIISQFTAIERNTGRLSLMLSRKSSLKTSEIDDALPGLPASALPVDELDKKLSLQMALKCADLGHLAESLEVHKRWVYSLEDEFFNQGDTEKNLGLAVSPLFDRHKHGVTKSQVGFFKFIALPLFRGFTNVFTQASLLYDAVKSNLDYWVEEEAKL